MTAWTAPASRCCWSPPARWSMPTAACCSRSGPRASRWPACGNFRAARSRPARRRKRRWSASLREEIGIETKVACLAPLTFASHTYETFHLLMPLFVCRRFWGIAAAARRAGAEMGAAETDARLSDAAGRRAADPVPDRSALATWLLAPRLAAALIDPLSRREKLSRTSAGMPASTAGVAGDEAWKTTGTWCATTAAGRAADAGMGMLRITLLFGSAAVALALDHRADRRQPDPVRRRADGDGRPASTTMTHRVSIGHAAAATYTIRRSVLQSSPDAVCVIRDNGKRSGDC